jgi:hypothetical protein
MTNAPIRDSFAIVRRAPSLWLAEIAWRWGFGASALALTFLTLWNWLDSLRVSNLDRVLLGSGSPWLMSEAINHIFAGTGVLLLRASAVLLPGFIVLWTLAAAIGRAATLRTVMPDAKVRWRSLIGVSFLRAMVAVAATVGTLATLIVFVRLALPGPTVEGRPGAAWLLLTILTFVIGTCWSFVNWFLSVAPIYAMRASRLSAALDMTMTNFREHTGQWFRIASLFGLMHFGLFFFFSGVGPMPLMFVGTAPRWFVIFAIVALTLVYFALVDGIAVARLVAYVRIAEDVHHGVAEARREEEPVQSVV